MSQFLKLTIITKFIHFLLLSCLQSAGAVEDNIPLLYLGSQVTKCNTESPENFYRDVAFPALLNLQEESNGFFGILMDKMEASVADAEEDEKAKLDKTWLYLMENIQNSLESVIHRIRTSWGILVSIYDTEALPWELSIQGQLAGEFLNDIGYQYAMFDAVVKAGVKEIVGTLQLQLAQIIKKLESDVSKHTKKDEEVSEIKLLNKMSKSLKKMQPNFVGNLLKKIVQRAIAGRTPDGLIKESETSDTNTRTFLTDIMEETALVLQAYRQKGQFYPFFWREMTKIMGEDDSGKRDFSSFIEFYNSNEDNLIENIIALLTSSNKFS